jgi:hypothetical protein
VGAAAPAPRERAFTPVPTQTEEHEEEAIAPPAIAPKRAFWLGLVAMGVLLALALAIWLLGSEPALTARVTSKDGKEFLVIEAPSAPAGTKARFSGREQVLKAGQAEFALPSDALSLGENELAIRLVRPDGEVESATVALDVDYRARLDLAPLAAQDPAIDVVVDAKPGSKIWIDGDAVTPDGAGRAMRRYPLPARQDSTFAFKAAYRIALPGGDVAEGALRLALPVTALHLDRPGQDVVTDQATLEVAGAVDEDATVSLNGEAVEVRQGRFLRRVALAEPGDHSLRVVARSPSKAPRLLEIRVRRVEDLSVAAASFAFDPELTYAKIQPNPLIYRGQHVRYDGRVYNVEVSGGRSVLQVLVLDCPRGARCPLWVEYDQATEVTVDSWVRVLGVVAGEQQFRSRQGQVQTVPSVRAQYVLKLAR